MAPELLRGLGRKHVLVDQLVDPLLVLELLLAHHQQPDKTQSTPTLREGERECLFAFVFFRANGHVCRHVFVCARICVCLWGRESVCVCVCLCGLYLCVHGGWGVGGGLCACIGGCLCLWVWVYASRCLSPCPCMSVCGLESVFTQVRFLVCVYVYMPAFCMCLNKKK